MLSQRMVRCFAQVHADVGTGVCEPRPLKPVAGPSQHARMGARVESRALLAKDQQKVHRTLAAMRCFARQVGRPGLGDIGSDGIVSALSGVQDAWTDFEQALAIDTATPADIARCDASAWRMLQAAEMLVASLLAPQGDPVLATVNCCGRTRMQVQRLAKEVLLAEVLGDPDRRKIARQLCRDVSRSHVWLRRLPWTTPAMAKALSSACCLRPNLVTRDLPTVMRAADDALALLHRLTREYERCVAS